MELYVRGKRLLPEAARAVPGGAEVRLRGAALLSLLDASDAAPGSIELIVDADGLRGGCAGQGPHLGRCVGVTGIRMHGASSTVTLQEIVMH